MVRVDRGFLNQIPDQVPNPVVLNQTKFNRGVISVVDQSNLPNNALKELTNATLIEDGTPQLPGYGVGWYGADLGGVIDGAQMHVDSSGNPQLLALVAGAVKRTTNNATTWSSCTGATVTSGKKADFEQTAGFTFVGNGYDKMFRYDGTTTLLPYTALTLPVGNAPSKTGLAGTTYTYRYRVSAYNSAGNTIASAAQTVQVDRLRPNWDASNKVTFTWGTVTGAAGYNIYVGQVASEEAFIDTVSGQDNTTYDDQGAAVEQVAILAPTSDTTGGPAASSLSTVGTRLYAIEGDTVWISGAGNQIGQFGSTSDATYTVLMAGSQFKPVRVEDYRDGKGTPLATVWFSSTDGRGCIWQGSLESFTVGDTTFPVPTFNRLPGSRGTNARFGVVNVLNDYMYPNSQAIYNLGSRAQFLNLLSTDESSVNIRPDVRRITNSAQDKIAGHYSTIEGKVFISAPFDGSTTNSATMLYDTERKAWLPEALTLGFERIFPYTDTSGDHHILAWKPGDTQLSEISADISGYYGAGISASLISGLNHYNPKNRADFFEAGDAFVEFSNPRGTITAELSGIFRDDGYKALDPVTIEPDSSLYDWSVNEAWSVSQWSTVSAAPTSFAEPSMKRYFEVAEDMNAYQWRISTEDVESKCVVRTLQIDGTATGTGKDEGWEIVPA